MLKSEYTFDLFSRYRGELMGLAIIGVLIAHIIGLGEISNSNILIKSIAFIPRLAFTQGFLFLSGFGLCYSFSKNSSIKRFYTRRLRRLMIPFIILSAWYYIFLDFIETCNPVTFILHLSSIAFWIVGNYNGMWYIGISVLLYSLFPLFYKLILTNKGGITLLILITISLILSIQHFLPTYYSKISIGIEKIPIFILGIYVGQLSLRKKLKESIILSCTVVATWIISFTLKNNWEYGGSLYGMAEKIVYMSIICVFLSVSENWYLMLLVRKLLKWFGRYSLELYVLHLQIYCFLSSDMLFGNTQPLMKVCVMVVGALLLCVPFHKLTDVIVRKINLK